MRTAHAVSYSLNIAPGRVQESDAPGVLLTLSVTEASVGSLYRFIFQITDPAGNTQTAQNQTASAPSAFVLSVSYPSEFGTSINLIGNYTVNVQQTQPTNIASVQMGDFQVRLTDKETYQRTFPVSIKARGYPSLSTVDIDISHSGVSAPSYPKILGTDSSGSLSTSWTIPPNASTGLWTVSLTGPGPVKSVPDIQTFTVYPTNVTVSQLTKSGSVLERTGNQTITFTALYLSGLPVQTGLAHLRVTESDGITSFSITANYSASLAAFMATYKVQSSDERGIWLAALEPRSLDDGNGNGGPSATVETSFTVIPATLSVIVSISNETFGPGRGIPVYAVVTNPDGAIFSSGSVKAAFSYNFTVVGNPLSLTYVPGRAMWAGVFSIGSRDPSGLWLVTVTAMDSYGNTGYQISSAVVEVPPSNPLAWLTSYSFLILTGAIIAAALPTSLFLVRRKAKRTEVSLDIKMVDALANKIQGDEFFQNVKKQVETAERSGEDQSSDRG